MALALLALLAGAGGVWGGVPALPGFAALWAAFAVAYNFVFSRRGYGEWCQGLGLALVAAAGHHAQAGTSLPPGAALALFLVGYSAHLVTALPHWPSDAAGGKRTFPVRFGPAVTRRYALGAVVLAALAMAAAVPASRPVGAAVAGAALALRRWPLRLAGTTAVDPDVARDPLACSLFVAAVTALHVLLLGGWAAALLFG